MNPAAPTPTTVVRSATREDLSAIAPLAARLVREHHGYDAQRFLLIEPVEEGYRWFLNREIDNPDVVLLVATEGATGDVIGYAYGGLVERDWQALREACGALHDVYVDERARRRGVAEALVREMIARLKSRGAPRVVLSSAWPNKRAQSLFARIGFRPTMVEMTIETDAGGGKTPIRAAGSEAGGAPSGDAGGSPSG